MSNARRPCTEGLCGALCGPMIPGMWARGTLFLLCWVALVGCRPVANDPSYRQASAQVSAEDAVKQRLRDPDTAKFEDEIIRLGPGGALVCGRFNAANGFGGRAGYQRFIVTTKKSTYSDGTPKEIATAIALEEETPRLFRRTWGELCAAD